MTTRLLIIIVLIVLPVNVFTQISGVVIDKSSGYPVQNANIRIENDKVATVSDLRGNFTFNQNVAGKTLIVSAIGFISERAVADSSFMRIELKTKVFIMDEAVVVAEKSNTQNTVGKHVADSVSYRNCYQSGSGNKNCSDSLRQISKNRK
jgi:hypothetical protein